MTTVKKKLALRRETIRTGLRAGDIPFDPITPINHGVHNASANGDATMGHGASGIVASPDAPSPSPGAAAAASGNAGLVSFSR